MRRQGLIYQYLLGSLVMAGTAFVGVGEGWAQALHQEMMANGTQLIVVAEPMTDGATAAWVVPPFEGEPESVVGGELTFLAELEAALRSEGQEVPSVVAVVGGVPVREIRRVIDRAVAGRLASGSGSPRRPAAVEGGVERRLGAPGSQALLSLTIPLPGPDDGQRSSLDVLGDLLPRILGVEAPGLRVRSEGDTLVLDMDVEPELADLALRRLRLGMARLGASAELDADAVEVARLRLEVRRRALLEQSPENAESLVALWTRGGVPAVRQHLFGLAGVTVESVVRAARQWLPSHPGAATVTLPPLVFHPRFAAAPRRVVAAGDLSAVVLERPGSPLATACLRPVVLPDIDGAVSATVLARLSAAIRADEMAPGWARVESGPARLELAASPDAFPELLEALQRSLATVAADPRPVDQDLGDPRRAVLRLMAVHLGLSEDGEVAPANLLRSGNLALGVVAADAEAAVDALEKLLAGDQGAQGVLDSRALGSSGRTRAALPGDRSALAVSLPLMQGLGRTEADVLRAVLAARGRALLPEADIEILRPLVPGRRVLVAIVVLEGQLDQVEEQVSGVWAEWTADVAEEELATTRRQVAAATAVSGSGALGRARRCAELAAAGGAWSEPAGDEMEALGCAAERLSAAMEKLREWEGRIVTGAGPLPVTSLPLPAS